MNENDLLKRARAMITCLFLNMKPTGLATFLKNVHEGTERYRRVFRANVIELDFIYKFKLLFVEMAEVSPIVRALFASCRSSVTQARYCLPYATITITKTTMPTFNNYDKCNSHI